MNSKAVCGNLRYYLSWHTGADPPVMHRSVVSEGATGTEDIGERADRARKRYHECTPPRETLVTTTLDIYSRNSHRVGIVVDVDPPLERMRSMLAEFATACPVWQGLYPLLAT